MIDLTTFESSALLGMQVNLETAAKSLVAQQKELQKELHRRYSSELSEQYKRKTAMGGTAKAYDPSGDLLAHCNISKKVEWDQKLLAEANLLFQCVTVKYFVSEKHYDAACGELRKALDDARTVKYGTPKIVLQARTDAD